MTAGVWSDETKSDPEAKEELPRVCFLFMRIEQLNLCKETFNATHPTRCKPQHVTVGQQRSNLTRRPSHLWCFGDILMIWRPTWTPAAVLQHGATMQPAAVSFCVFLCPIWPHHWSVSPPLGLQHVPGQLSKKENPGIVCLCSGPIPAHWAAPAGSDLGDAAAPISL